LPKLCILKVVSKIENMLFKNSNKVNIFYTQKPIHLLLSGADPKVIPLSSFHCIRETDNVKTNTEIVSDSKS
jgi:hypothetical protein